MPEGWLIDRYGEPTTEPNDFKDNLPGAILPLEATRVTRDTD